MAGFGGLGFPLKITGNPGVFLAVSVGTQWETRGKNAGRGLGRKRFPQKKVLSLVLCVAMMLSVMVMSTGATSFSDEDEFSPQYKEAAEVLTGMGVIQGYEDGSYFLPQRNITRAQVATMIYRAVTHDVNDTQTGIYKDYNKFKDVPSTDWSAGYVNYCANGEIIKGFTPDTFGPLKNVTGYQVLAMILRAVGYDANDEFTGDGWAIRVATTAQQLDILENVQEATLGEPATRELVAELIFQTMTKVDMVDYTPAFGYQPTWPRETLGEDEFGLTKGDRDTIDDWGRPGYVWSYDTGDKSTTIEEAALATYKTAVTECDVADDTTDKDATYDLYVNSDKNNAGEYTINATDTTTKIGAQGRLTEVYTDRIVMIDTFLAQVDSVKDATFDAAGHMKTPATINLVVYDGKNSELTLTNGETNYPYTEDQMVLLNAYTNGTNNAKESGYVITVDKDGKYGEILDAATAVTGTQTIIYNNADQHNVNGTVYDDAMKFIRDEAGNSTANFTWFFDQYNNLIGATKIAADTNYGVINSIWWAGNAADGSGTAQANVTYMDGTTGTVTIGYMTVSNAAVGAQYVKYEGAPTYSTNTGDIMTFQSNGFRVSTDADTNEDYDTNFDIVDGNLFQFTTLDNGTMAAKEVAGNGTELFNTWAAVKQDVVVNNGNPNLIVDANTIFLVKNADDTFTSITGYNNIESYVAGEVDFVNLDKDRAAEYVYITAEPEDATTNNLFYYNDGQIEYNTKDHVWTIPGYVDGVAANIYVYDKAKTGEVTGNTAWENVVNVIETKGAHNLYQVTIENGYVDTASELTAITDGTTLSMSESNIYDDIGDTIKVAVITGADGDKYVGTTYEDKGTWTYGTNGDTLVPVGAFESDMSDYNVILVWNADNRVILQAYIVDKDTTVDNLRPINPVTLTADTITAGTTTPDDVTWTINYAGYGDSSNTTDQATLKVTDVTWEKLDANDKFVAWDGDVFSAGTYRYTATMAIDNADYDENGVDGCYLPSNAQTVVGTVTVTVK